MANNLTQELVRDLLNYDPETGIFTWRKLAFQARAVKLGDSAGTRHSSGYWQLCIEGKRYLAHRVAWLYVHGVWPKEQLDHIDRDKTNNRIANLRIAAPHENQRNRATPCNSRTGVKGVSERTLRTGRVKFVATIKPRTGNQIFLGSFDTLEEARAARVAGARALYGAFANEETGPPDDN